MGNQDHSSSQDLGGHPVSSLLGEDCWRPIDTAPLDGTEVDLWRDGERLTNWRFNARRHGWSQEVGYPVVTVYLIKQPSHWMPVPDGPKGQDGQLRDEPKSASPPQQMSTKGRES